MEARRCQAPFPDGRHVEQAGDNSIPDRYITGMARVLTPTTTTTTSDVRGRSRLD